MLSALPLESVSEGKVNFQLERSKFLEGDNLGSKLFTVCLQETVDKLIISSKIECLIRFIVNLFRFKSSLKNNYYYNLNNLIVKHLP